MTFCVGVRNCPSRSRWVANKQPPVLGKGKTPSPRFSSNFSQIFSEFNIWKIFWYSTKEILLGPIEYVCHLYPVTPNTVMGFVWKEEFSHWLRSSFGHCSSPRPISNSQGYFQLMIHLCHLDAAPAQLPQFSIIANQRRNLAMLNSSTKKRWSQKNSDPASRDFPRRYSQQMASSSSSSSDGRRCWLGRQTVPVCSTSLIIYSPSFYTSYDPFSCLLWI